MNPEKIYSDALDALKQAQTNYANAESNLIKAERAVKIAELGTKYHKMLNAK